MSRARLAAVARSGVLRTLSVICAVFFLLGVTAGSLAARFTAVGSSPFGSVFILSAVLNGKVLLCVLRRFLLAAAVIFCGWSVCGVGLIPFLLFSAAFRAAFTQTLLLSSGGSAVWIGPVCGELFVFLPFLLLLCCLCAFVSREYLRGAVGGVSVRRVSAETALVLLIVSLAVCLASCGLDLIF